MWWKTFKKELRMIKKDDEDFQNSTKWWTCNNGYVDGDLKVKDHCHITKKIKNIKTLHYTT